MLKEADTEMSAFLWFAIIHYPEDKDILEGLYKEIAEFRLETVIQQISSLNFPSDSMCELISEILAYKRTWPQSLFILFKT